MPPLELGRLNAFGQIAIGGVAIGLVLAVVAGRPRYAVFGILVAFLAIGAAMYRSNRTEESNQRSTNQSAKSERTEQTEKELEARKGASDPYFGK